MATASKTVNPESVRVAISLNLTTNQLQADPKTFWIEESQEVVWECKRIHDHLAEDCFDIEFESPDLFVFQSFHHNLEHTGAPKKGVAHNKLFHYTLTLPGATTQPSAAQGGVKPSAAMAQTFNPEVCVYQGGVKP